MGQLERLFLGSLILTGLLILFLFGLYFDIGDMVAGTFRGNKVGFGQDQSLIARRRRLAQDEPVEVHRAPNRRGTHSAGGGSTGPVNYRRYTSSLPPVSRDTLIDREVRRLQRKGFVDQEFIRMRAIYEVDRSLIPVFDQYDQLMDADDPEGAIAVLLDALKHIDKGNILGQRDIHRYLYQAYVMAGKDQQATNGLAQLTEIHERIVGIEERAELHQDAESQTYLKKMRTGFGQLRESMKAMQGEPGAETKTWDMVRRIQSDKKITIDERMIQGAKAAFLDKADDSAGRKAARELLDKFQAGDFVGEMSPGSQ